MVALRFALVLGLVGVAACHRAGTQVVPGHDASIEVGPADAALEAPATGDLAIEKAPPAVEICGNGLDDDADGKVDEGCSCAQGATQDCYPGTKRLAGVGLCAAGKQACMGDQEFGGWGPCEHAITPAPEVCDGLDNNCDGTVDDGCLCTIGATRALLRRARRHRAASAPAAREHRAASPAWRTSAASGACNGDVRPDVDVCDGLDNDCNGTVDDGCACQPGDSRDCYGGAAGTQGVGPCAAGRQSCVTKPGGSEWGACEGQTLPRPELCDRIDNDCDGVVDDGCELRGGRDARLLHGPGGHPRRRHLQRRDADLRRGRGRRRQRLGRLRRRPPARGRDVQRAGRRLRRRRG